mgnify:CR=1 FL=1
MCHGSEEGSAYNTLALSRLFSSEANRKLPEDILRDMLRVEAWAYGLLTEGHTKPVSYTHLTLPTKLEV